MGQPVGQPGIRPDRDSRVPVSDYTPQSLADELCAGGTLRTVGASNGISGERVRQIIAGHPALRTRVIAAQTARAIERQTKASNVRARDRQRRRAVAKTGTKKFTDVELEQFFRRFLEAHDGRASSQAFKVWCNENGPPGARTYTLRYGPSWQDVCAKFGVTPPGGRGTTITAAQCEAAVRRVAAAVGQLPTVAQYIEHKRPDEPADHTVRIRLGGGRWAGVTAFLLANPEE